VTEEVREQAKALGWADKDQWRGPPEHWVDADVFVERGKTVLPIVKENNERLQSTVSKQQQELETVKQQLEDTRKAMEDFKQFHGEELKRKVAETRKELIRGIEEARKEGNVDAVVEMTEQLDNLTEAARVPPPEPKKPTTATPPPSEVHPDFLAWRQQNPWYGTDPVDTGLANGIAAKLREDPANASLVGRAFFDRVAKEVAAYKQPARTTSKMEGGGGNGAGKAGTASSGFDSLPPEAQAYAKEESRRMVGQNKPFKTEKEWFDYYANHY
jgi:hypothetical protein